MNEIFSMFFIQNHMDLNKTKLNKKYKTILEHFFVQIKHIGSSTERRQNFSHSVQKAIAKFLNLPPLSKQNDKIVNITVFTSNRITAGLIKW